MAKIIWLYAWAVAATLIVFLPIMISILIDPGGNAAFQLSRCWAWVVLRAAGVKLLIRHPDRIDKNRSYIIISNHQSHFDSLALVRTLGIPFRWVAKKELQKIPLFGQALKALGTVFIDRTDRQKAVASLHHGLKRMPAGVSLMFFAEGTRSVDGEIKAFKKGGFITAIETGWPILPVTINGSRKALPKGSLVFHPGTIEVVVGEPIDSAKYTPDDMDSLLKDTRTVIVSNIRPSSQ